MFIQKIKTGNKGDSFHLSPPLILAIFHFKPLFVHRVG